MNAMDTLAGAAVGLAGLFMLMQASMMGAPALGWVTRPWHSRAILVIVALTFWVRAWTLLFAGSHLPMIGWISSFALCLWQFIELLDVITTSWRSQVETGRRLAALDRRKARQALDFAVTMIRWPTWRNGCWRDPKD